MMTQRRRLQPGDGVLEAPIWVFVYQEAVQALSDLHAISLLSAVPMFISSSYKSALVSRGEWGLNSGSREEGSLYSYSGEQTYY